MAISGNQRNEIADSGRQRMIVLLTLALPDWWEHTEIRNLAVARRQREKRARERGQAIPTRIYNKPAEDVSPEFPVLLDRTEKTRVLSLWRDEFEARALKTLKKRCGGKRSFELAHLHEFLSDHAFTQASAHLVWPRLGSVKLEAGRLLMYLLATAIKEHLFTHQLDWDSLQESLIRIPPSGIPTFHYDPDELYKGIRRNDPRAGFLFARILQICLRYDLMEDFRQLPKARKELFQQSLETFCEYTFPVDFADWNTPFFRKTVARHSFAWKKHWVRKRRGEWRGNKRMFCEHLIKEFGLDEFQPPRYLFEIEHEYYRWRFSKQGGWTLAQCKNFLVNHIDKTYRS